MSGGCPGGQVALGLATCGVLIEAGLLLVLRLGRPASHIPEYLTYYLLTSIPYVVACFVITKQASATPRRALGWIWLAAVAFRLTVLPLQPSLSEDTVRYRWQGMVQAAGGDPYEATPGSPAWTDLRDETWPRVTGKDKSSAYGPLVEQVNAWYYRSIRGWVSDPWVQVWAFKLPFALADLGVGIALMALLSAVGRPRSWVLVYLWSPLAVTEFWMEGHNDALAIACSVVALALSCKGRSAWALVSLAVAVMCKFWPAVLLPFVAFERDGGRWRFEWRGALAGSLVAAALCLPYWNSIGSVWQVLQGFSGGWRNNDSLFGLFLMATGGDAARAADVATGALLLVVLALRFSRLPRVAGELGVIVALLLVSANCFPWYLTWMLPFVAVHPRAPLLLWSALAGLSYHVVQGYEIDGTWAYDQFLTALEYTPVLAWVAFNGVRRLRARLRLETG